MLKLGMIALTASLLVPVADEVPRWDIATSCKASTGAADGTGERYSACVRDETSARDQIASVWTVAKPSYRETCVGSQSMGNKSFVELMTCLQIADSTLPFKK